MEICLQRMRKRGSIYQHFHLSEALLPISTFARSTDKISGRIKKRFHSAKVSHVWAVTYRKSTIDCYYHVTYAFYSESTLYNSRNVKELLSRNMVQNLKFK